MEGAQPSSQDLQEGGDSDDDYDDQAVKVLHAFRSSAEDADPGFERELAALLGDARGATRPALADPGAPAPAAAAGDDGATGRVKFQVVLRRGGGRETHTRTVQVGCLLIIPRARDSQVALGHLYWDYACVQWMYIWHRNGVRWTLLRRLIRV